MKPQDILVWLSVIAIYFLAYHINPTIQTIPSILLSALGTGMIIVYYSIKEFEKLANHTGKLINKIYAETTKFIEHITDLILDTVRKTLVEELGNEKGNKLMDKIYDRLTITVQSKITNIVNEIRKEEQGEKEDSQASKMFI